MRTGSAWTVNTDKKQIMLYYYYFISFSNDSHVSYPGSFSQLLPLACSPIIIHRLKKMLELSTRNKTPGILQGDCIWEMRLYMYLSDCVPVLKISILGPCFSHLPPHYKAAEIFFTKSCNAQCNKCTIIVTCTGDGVSKRWGPYKL